MTTTGAQLAPGGRYRVTAMALNLVRWVDGRIDVNACLVVMVPWPPRVLSSRQAVVTG